MHVREALPTDAEAMSRVLTASIVALCHRDHRGDPVVIARWTANKTPAGVASWFDVPENRLFVAEEEDGRIAAVGGLSTAGEIRLNYVAPEMRFKGASKALLAHMEAALRERGVSTARLTSTATAHRFYRSAGWSDDGPPESCFGVDACYPMTKRLTADGA